MGITAEKVAEEWKVSREDQDAFALGSHQKALAATKAGEFRDEISPYEVVSHQPDLGGNTIRLKKLLVENDEGPRPATSPEGLAKLRPVFRSEEHTSELQSLMRLSYAVFCLQKKNKTHTTTPN